MPRMRPEQELMMRDRAFRNPAAADNAITEQSAQKSALAVKDNSLSGLWAGDPNQPKLFPEAIGTGFSTSEGLPIESSYGNANDFWSQIGINNILDKTPSGAMTYQGYLAYNGLTDPRVDYARNLDAAQKMYARAIGTYGASGEGLAQGNLANSGYSEYLTGLAYQLKNANMMQAQSQMRTDLKQTAAGYGQYVSEYEANKAAEEPAAQIPSENGVLNEAAANVFSYFADNGITNEADFPAAVIALRSQGYSDEDINAALENWVEYTSAGIGSQIGRISALAAGNASLLKDTYGEGSKLYKDALSKLQKQNAGLVKSAVAAVNAGDFDSQAFSDLMSAVRESTASTDKEGNQVYEWDSSNDESKAAMFMTALRDMFAGGDIDADTYNQANYDIISETVKNAMDKKYFAGGGRKQLVNVLESLAYVEKYPDAVSEKQKKELFGLASGKISNVSRSEGNEVRGEGAGYKFKFNGKNVSYREESGSVGGLLSDQKLTEPQHDALRELLRLAGVSED